jgi:mono/diheme cytochrome c family protein
VVITQVLTSCGCTVASLPSQPWHIAPGTGGRINATVNLAGKFGTVIKTLTVLSSAGNKILTIKAEVPMPAPQDPEMAARIRNQEASKVDRLAVFKNDCAQCHLTPAFGKMGKELFTGLCGVCHEAKQRATMVPDLRTVNKDNDPEIWRAFIKHGKVASLMPPFDQAEGGPLSTQQIDSLVAYLTTDFQKEPRAVAQQPAPMPNTPLARPALMPRTPLSAPPLPPPPPPAPATPRGSPPALK